MMGRDALPPAPYEPPPLITDTLDRLRVLLYIGRGGLSYRELMRAGDTLGTIRVEKLADEIQAETIRGKALVEKWHVTNKRRLAADEVYRAAWHKSEKRDES